MMKHAYYICVNDCCLIKSISIHFYFYLSFLKANTSIFFVSFKSDC